MASYMPVSWSCSTVVISLTLAKVFMTDLCMTVPRLCNFSVVFQPHIIACDKMMPKAHTTHIKTDEDGTVDSLTNIWRKNHDDVPEGASHFVRSRFKSLHLVIPC